MHWLFCAVDFSNSCVCNRFVTRVIAYRQLSEKGWLLRAMHNNNIVHVGVCDQKWVGGKGYRRTMGDEAHKPHYAAHGCMQP